MYRDKTLHSPRFLSFLWPKGGFNNKNCRRLASWGAGICALIAYVLTLESDASFWDCPEYLVTAVRLEPGHPPGNPVWSLTARIFSLLGGSNPQHIAYAVNLSSAIFSALAVGILASCIYILLSLTVNSRFCRKSIPGISKYARSLMALASVGGALCFGWSDSVWFSAVEAEVYAMSLFMTALCVRLMLGWALRRNREAARRELLLITYTLGLSIGIHQLNLLVIPALGLIWLFHRYRSRTGFLIITLTLVVSMAAVGIILLLFMPGVIKLAALTELFCVNRLRLPYNSGVIIFWTIAAAICWFTPIIMQRSRNLSPRIVILAWIPAMLLTGYSAYMILLVRGAANPPMNEGAPTDIFALQSYLGRDQYGSTPLFYGRTPYSRPMRQENIKPDGTADYSHTATRLKEARYAKAPADSAPRYLLYDHAKEVIYTPELNMLLPRITSCAKADIESYADWAGMTPESMTEVEISYAIDSLGKPVGQLNADGERIREKELRPTYLQNLRYLTSYQIYYMYLRYLLWNYSGRQNDRFATGEVEHGNFITGIPPIDNAMLGPQSMLPDEIGSKNRGRNVYFLLPLLMGILGILFLQDSGKWGKRSNLVITMLFLMTGVAIVIYLNQSPREPRERDYSFLGSYWAYAIWIGAGLMSLIIGAARLGPDSPLLKRLPESAAGIITRILFGAAAAFSIILPLWMLFQNYDDHDRSGREGVSRFAANMLESLEPDAILFTNGDNFTFPLWWAQEVAGIRRDVTIINTAYMVTPWYVVQMMREGEESRPLLMQGRPEDIAYGDANVSYYQKSSLIPSSEDSLKAMDALEALRRRYSSDDASNASDASGFRFPAILRLANPSGGDSIYLRTSAIASASSHINLKQLASLDIIASNAASESPRPVYWLAMLPSGDYAGLYPLTSRALHTRRLVYTDSLGKDAANHYLDLDMAAARSTLSGRSGSKPIYADASFGPMITQLRLGLLRLGGRLLREGRRGEALEVSRIIRRNFPPEEWEYQIVYESDSACFEGTDLARLILESSQGNESLKDEYAEGKNLLEREYKRHLQWRDFRRALPQRYKNVMTPKNRRKSTLSAYIDSLRNAY